MGRDLYNFVDRKRYFGVPGIYAIIHNDMGMIYIGKSINLYKRCNSHKNSLIKGIHSNIHLQRFYNKYGGKGIKLQVFMTIPKIGNYRKKLIELEQAYLDIYWDNNKKCFNINKLAESPNITEHTKYLHSKFMKEFWKNNRKKMTKIVSNNLDKARKAYKRMIRDGHKFPAPNKGKKTPLSVRKKQSISAKKRGCHDVLKRPVKMLTISGRYVRTFESLSSAAIYFSGNYRQSSNIGKVCSGERKKAFGFKWEYLK